ncbi:trypco2 family protein [Cellulomonas wangsupingiae]|uniref:Trypsin-co-occurring domain-containing protein n=1 Tax=Cellulomonas wangsupingiae TaxID=2968085 RepID=A0ABY5K743_9CELL|nr:trypco2 family protein [Cellulomonas wangsupingiae]MCC2334771.1 hypothetical protein [Cellulomonas wangsupingiae]MCM0638510.1 hypothetical protein [Cellulomonas wangsupingiae]UUI66274.1 hypothetical protein NP075_06040 [Cellulomonas wangsupingiae]
MPRTDRPAYPLAEVLWQLGEELRAVAARSEEHERAPVVEVTTASARLTVTVTRDAKGGLSFGVLGVGADLGVGGSRETTTELTVDLKVAQLPGADAAPRSAVSFSPPVSRW